MMMSGSVHCQEITADVPEDSVLNDQQEVNPQKVRPIQTGDFLRNYVSRRLLALSRRIEGDVDGLLECSLAFGWWWLKHGGA